MTGIKLDTFAGLFPRLPAERLPANAATQAENCEFAYGELRPLKAPFMLKTLASAVVTAFSEDGLRFFTWPRDVNAVISPLGSGPSSDRLYFTDGYSFRMTLKSGASTFGGEPGISYQVGVPKPTRPPVLAIARNAKIDRIIGYLPTVKFHYENAGLKYQEQEISFSVIEEGQKYGVSIPPRTVNAKAGQQRAELLASKTFDPMSTDLRDPTPDTAVPVFRMQFVKTNSIGVYPLLDQYTSNSKFATDDVAITMTINSTDQNSATLTIGDVFDSKDSETRAYTYTLVNIFNEEGAPSPPAVINCYTKAAVSLLIELPDMLNYAPIKEVRIYRIQAGGVSADYYYACSFNYTGGPTIQGADRTSAAELNELLSSENNYPPKASLQGLTNIGNGILAAWSGNELWFSEPYKPWAWPPKYMLTLQWPVVGMVQSANMLLVTTLGFPYIVSGISPDAMTSEKLNMNQAGVSKWSIASVGGQLFYASNDGIVAVSGAQGSLDFSERYFTREVWRAKYGNYLGTMQIVEYDGSMLVFSRTGAFKAFLIRLDESQGSMTELPGFAASGAFYLVTTDGLYYASENNLYIFAGGAPQSFVWMSKEIRLTKPACFAIANAVSSGNITIELYAMDGSGGFQLKHREQIFNQQEKTFRLPGGYRTDAYKVKVYGNGTLRSLKLAGSGRALGEM
jgi:hypothetical protein